MVIGVQTDGDLTACEGNARMSTYTSSPMARSGRYTISAALLLLGFLSQAHAAEQPADVVGIVRIGQDPPPNGLGADLSSNLSPHVPFYQSNDGRADDALAIVLPTGEPRAMTQSLARGCIFAQASIVPGTRGKVEAPKAGTTWRRHANRDGRDILLVAEAVHDFAILPTGRIKICRMQRVIGLMDGKPVHIPADTYTGACDEEGSHCRMFVLRGEAATLGPHKSDCVTIPAVLEESDGAPIKAGTRIRPQWSVGGFEPEIKAMTDIK